MSIISVIHVEFKDGGKKEDTIQTNGAFDWSLKTVSVEGTFIRPYKVLFLPLNPQSSKLPIIFPSPITVLIIHSEWGCWLSPVKRESLDFVSNVVNPHPLTASVCWLGSPFSPERSSLRRLTPRRSTAREVKERSAPALIDSDNRSSVAFVSSVSSVCHSKVCRYFHLHGTESFSDVSKIVWLSLLIVLTSSQLLLLFVTNDGLLGSTSFYDMLSWCLYFLVRTVRSPREFGVK